MKFDFWQTALNWICILVFPKKTIDRLLTEDCGYGKAVWNFALAVMILACLMVLLWIASPIYHWILILFPAFIFGIFATAVALSAIFAGILHIIASLFGGKSEFKRAYYVISTASVPLIVLNYILGWINQLFANIYFPAVLALTIASSIYSAYILTIIYKRVYRLGTARAIATWLLPTLLYSALMVMEVIITQPGLVMAILGRTLGN